MRCSLTIVARAIGWMTKLSTNNTTIKLRGHTLIALPKVVVPISLANISPLNYPHLTPYGLFEVGDSYKRRSIEQIFSRLTP